MKINEKEKIVLAHDNLQRINNWISHADQKVGVALAFQAGLIAFLTTSKADDIKKILLQGFDLVHFILYFSLVFFFFSIAKGSYWSFKALYPDIKPREDSLFFFGSIVNKGVSKFKKAFSIITEDEAVDDLNNQVFINSKIALSKFSAVQRSIKHSFYAFCFWLIVLLLTAFLV